jgi:hypothetical protein
MTSCPHRALMGCLAVAVLAGGLITFRARPVLTAAEQGGEPGGGAPAGAFATIFTRVQPMLTNVTDAYEVVRLWPDGDAFRTARNTLRQPCCKPLDFLETPFRDAIAVIADLADFPIALDHKAFDAVGFDPDTPVTAHIADRSWADCLRSLLDALDLTFVHRNGQVLVTSLEAAEADLEKVFYPVIPGVDAEAVADVIVETICPGSWRHEGGSGAIMSAPAGMGHGLIVSHHGHVQDQVEALLRGLDAAHWGDDRAGEAAPDRFVRIYEIDDEAARADLARQLSGLVNAALPGRGDPDARVTVIGRSIVVSSRSRGFQVMAAQIVVAVTGFVQELEITPDDVDPGAGAEEPRPGAGAET